MAGPLAFRNVLRGLARGLARTLAPGLALGPLLLGWLALGPTVHAQPAPLAERLTEAWRWRQLRDPDHPQAFYHSVHPWGDGQILATDDDGPVAFDGWTWHREPGWVLPRLRAVDAVYPLDAKHVVVGTPYDVRVLDSREGQAWVLEAEVPSDLTRVVRWLDGRPVVGWKGAIYHVAVTGLEPLLTGPPGTDALVGLVASDDGQAYAMSERGVYRLDGERWVPLKVPRGFPGHRLWHVLMLAEEGRVVILPSTAEGASPGWILRDGVVEPLTDGSGRVEVADAVLLEGQVLAVSDDPALRALAVDQGPDDGAWQALRPPFRVVENIVSAALSGPRLSVVTASGDLWTCDLDSTRWQAFDPKRAGLGPAVNALAPASAGGIWVATDDGVGRFVDGEFRDVRRVAGETGERILHPTTVVEDAEGALWIGSGAGFSDALRWKDGHWTHVEISPDGPAHLHRIRRLGDDLYFLLLGDSLKDWHGGDVRRWHDGRVEPFGQTADGSPLPRCYDLLQTRDGRLLLGTFTDVYERVDGAWHPLGPPTLGRGPHFRLYEQADGTLWSGRGLRNPGAFARTPSGWRLFDSGEWKRAGAAEFCEPGDGRTYFTSAYGLFVLDGLGCHELSGQLPTRTFWPMLPDGQGGLWIGSPGVGLVHYGASDATPPVVTHVDYRYTKEGRTEVAWSATDAWNDTPPDQLSYRVEVDGAPLRFDHSADGTRTHERSAVLADLSPGRHVLTVTAVDRFGNADPAPPPFEFVVPTPAWRSAAALAGLAASLCVAIALALVLMARRREQRVAEHTRADFAERLSMLTRRLLEAQEEERRLLAREMHDDLGQALTAARLGIDGARRATDPDRREAALERTGFSLAHALERVRHISHGLRPLVLDDHGLEQAVRSLVDEVGETPGGPDIDLQVDLDGPPVPPDIAGHVFRILQEALTNVLRHAGAHLVIVALSTTAREVTLTVQDDGKGFDSVRLPTVRRFGLLGMRERAELLDGRFQMESRVGEGTWISVSIPVRGTHSRQAPTRPAEGA